MRTRERLSLRTIVGIDEAGRGPIAGPVSVGVVSIAADFPRTFFDGIRDSKELSEAARETWEGKARQAAAEGLLSYSVAFSAAARIDRMGIIRALEEALVRAAGALSFSPRHSLFLLDGALSNPLGAPEVRMAVRGDAYEPLISLASILAKVERDRHMRKMAEVYPGYGFEEHKGYGTEGHYRAIKELGLCDIHRRSFIHLHSF